MAFPYGGVIYGPHFSRRIGMSLGVDLTPMTCNFDCIYCERGRTLHRIRDPEELDFKVDEEDFCNELQLYLKDMRYLKLDSLTFSGTGEPTLDLRLGKLIKLAREVIKEVPIRVITNSSLLDRKDVRRNLAEADEVIAKLNAISEDVFRDMHRPANNFLTPAKVVQSLRELNNVISEGVTIEVMFITSSSPSIKTNSTEVEVTKLSKALSEIQPLKVQVQTICRMPASLGVLPVDFNFLRKASSQFKEALGKEKISVYY